MHRVGSNLILYIQLILYFLQPIRWPNSIGLYSQKYKILGLKDQNYTVMCNKCLTSGIPYFLSLVVNIKHLHLISSICVVTLYLIAYLFCLRVISAILPLVILLHKNYLYLLLIRFSLCLNIAISCIIYVLSHCLYKIS